MLVDFYWVSVAACACFGYFALIDRTNPLDYLAWLIVLPIPLMNTIFAALGVVGLIEDIAHFWHSWKND